MRSHRYRQPSQLSMLFLFSSLKVPAQLLTMSLAFVPTLTFAIVAFFARSTISTMDSAVRSQSFYCILRAFRILM